jgi:hypothetical protein
MKADAKGPTSDVFAWSPSCSKPVSAANTTAAATSGARRRGHAQRHGENQAARGEDRARRRVEKGQLDLRLQQESSRQQQVGTAGRQGLHARPQRRQCPHGRTVTAPTAAIVVRSGDRGLILKDDAGSSRRDAQIAPMGDDAAMPSWERQQP